MDGSVVVAGHVRKANWAATRELSAHEGAVLLLHCLKFASTASIEIQQAVRGIITGCAGDDIDKHVALSGADEMYLLSLLEDGDAVERELHDGARLFFFSCPS